MATTITGAFNELHTRLTPTTTEVAAASSHRASVEAALKAHFDVVGFFQSGSWGNGTSVRIWSDVDYFVHLSYKHQTSNSRDLLSQVCQVLDRRFHSTPVRVDTPAVLVGFGSAGSERYEVVPAIIHKYDPDASVYEIPAPGGGWMLSSPKGQHGAVAGEDERLKGRLRPLIRFLKAWKYWNSVPISSFYLETFSTMYARARSEVFYGFDLHLLLDLLSSEGMPALPTLIGGGEVVACNDASDRRAAIDAAAKASVVAELAVDAQVASRVADAFRYWDLLFDGKFPAYG